MKYRIVPVTHYAQNCSVIWCPKTLLAAVVDPGGDVSKILEVIDENKLKLDKILLTHGHMDHVGGTAELLRQRPVPIIGPHKDDAFWIQALDQQAQMMGFDPAEGFVPDQWLDEGDVVELGQERLQVLHCPGHTPGHVVFFSAESRLAWVGDVLFRGSVGRSDFPRGDHDTLVKSIRTKLWPLGDEVEFIPGHGPNSNFGHERSTNPFVADKRFG